MANASFTAWVTNTAFSLNLTIAQIKAIRALNEHKLLRIEMLDPMTAFALDRRGLIRRETDGCIALTRAGSLLAELIDEAGFAPETTSLNTNRDAALKAESRLRQVLDLAQQGMGPSEIAETIGVNRTTVWRAMNRAKQTPETHT